MNSAPVPLTSEDLGATSEDDKLNVLVDGVPAAMFISSGEFSSDRVVLEFAEPHGEFGDQFVTKYFTIERPGVLSWGHEGRSFSVSIVG